MGPNETGEQDTVQKVLPGLEGIVQPELPPFLKGACERNCAMMGDILDLAKEEGRHVQGVSLQELTRMSQGSRALTLPYSDILHFRVWEDISSGTIYWTSYNPEKVTDAHQRDPKNDGRATGGTMEDPMRGVVAVGPWSEYTGDIDGSRIAAAAEVREVMAEQPADPYSLDTIVPVGIRTGLAR